MKIEIIQPLLKRNEKIVAHDCENGVYYRYTIQFERFLRRKELFDVYINVDEKKISIRYYHGECPDWAMNAFQSFLEKLQTLIKQLPDYRLRFATGAMKIDAHGYLSEDFDELEANVYDMAGMFLSVALGFASLFELFFFFHIPVYGYLGLLAVTSLFFLYALLDVYLDDKPPLLSWSTVTFLLVGMLFFAVMTIGVGLGLFVALALAWLIPLPLTIAGFCICLFAYDWAVSLIKKSFEWNQKYTAKS